MYLSQLTLNPKTKRVQSELSNPYELHRSLMSAFPNTLSQEERVLFRVEPITDFTPIRVLVQSIYQPDWTKVNGTNYFLQLPQVKSFSPQFVNGQCFLFRLLGNPTKKIKLLEGKNSKRVGLYRMEEQQDWLIRKSKNLGFHIIELRIVQHQHQITYKVDPEENKRKKMTHQGAQFEGVLEINESKIFMETFKNGIGSGKAFGFGLLSLAKTPIPD